MPRTFSGILRFGFKHLVWYGVGVRIQAFGLVWCWGSDSSIWFGMALVGQDKAIT